MDILKITDTKLKITLDAADMKKYKLKCEDVDYSDPAVRGSFFGILDEVRHKSGFDVDGDKVLIQFYPSKDGGSEIFVTKLGMMSAARERTIRRSGSVAMLSARRAIFRASSLDEAVAAARVVAKRHTVGKSDAFVGECGEYYLEFLLGGTGDISELSGISEYASPFPVAKYHYITEHCKKITKGNAVELLSAL